MNVYVIVPEGISLNDNNQIIPSFVFRQVLEYLGNILQKDSKVYFAPANNFNTKYFEQDIGLQYLLEILKKKNMCCQTFVAKSNINNYIDTMLNAKLLLDQYPDLKDIHVELVCAKLHSKRAKFCFENTGFKIKTTHKIEIEVMKERIVSRLWYYQYPIIHKIYEYLAFIRDIFLVKFLGKLI